MIFDPDWNPMVDIQATDRALRIGQRRDVEIYRFIVDDTLEEKIYHRQVFKKFMADKVLQDPTKQRLFEHSNMHELFEMPSKLLLNRDFEERRTDAIEVGEKRTRKEEKAEAMVKMYRLSKRNVK